MLGVVNLDKPVGPTSHDMVGLMRRLTGQRRIGHAGTLDPLASGVLPVLVGAATRFSEELTGGRKRYEAVIRLGVRSATDDAEGPLSSVDCDLPTEAAIRAGLAEFVGEIEQTPPTFSARKQGGRTAHRAARAGEPLEIPARRVQIESLALGEVTVAADHVDAQVEVLCGPGTYIRALARDLGERLGCGGYLASLRRTEAARLRVADAFTPLQLEALAADGRLGEAILPVAELLDLPRLALAEPDALRFTNGSVIQVSPPVPEDGRQAVFGSDRLLGIGRLRAGMLQPEKVIAPEAWS